MTAAGCRNDSRSMPKLSRVLGSLSVVPQHATEPLPTLDRPVHVRSLRARLDQLVAKSLVVALGVVVLDILADRLAKMPFAEWDDLSDAFRLDRPDETLRVRV
jgi:hypothetical protein